MSRFWTLMKKRTDRRTDQPTDGRTDRQTDTPSYGDALTLLKRDRRGVACQVVPGDSNSFFCRDATEKYFCANGSCLPKAHNSAPKIKMMMMMI